MEQLFSIQNEHLCVQACAFGAELRSIRGRDGTEYLWQGDPRYWTDRAPNLFPYVARLWQKTYRLDGKTYTMDIHGFAPYRTFQPVRQEADRLDLELTSDAETLRHYPRAFAFRVCYALLGNTLSVRYEIENRDEKPLFCGLGGHPGFRVPLADGERFSDYRLRLDAPAPLRIGFTPDCFLDGTEAPFPLENGTDLRLSHDLFDDDAIVLRQAGHSAQIVDGSGKTRVRVDFADMDYLGLWHMPRTDAPYLCIEPWCSLPSGHGEITDLAQKPDLLRVEPGKTACKTFSVTVS